MAVDRNAFGFESTTDEVLDGISLEGKRALITGTSGGLGAETARALAARGAAITLVARDLEKLEAVAASIRESTGNSNIDIGEMDIDCHLLIHPEYNRPVTVDTHFQAI